LTERRQRFCQPKGASRLRRQQILTLSNSLDKKKTKTKKKKIEIKTVRVQATSKKKKERKCQHKKGTKQKKTRSTYMLKLWKTFWST